MSYFDGYLVQESIGGGGGVKVLIGKRKSWIWGCKEDGKERIFWFLGVA